MIRKQELLKLTKTPTIPLLIIFFAALNVVIVMSNTHLKKDLSVLTNLVETYGYEINEDMMKQFGNDYQEKVKWVNKIAPGDDKTYKHPSELLSDDTVRRENTLSDSEKQKLLKYGVIEQYHRTAQNIDDFYKNIDLDSSAESIIKMHGFTGSAADEVRDQYQTLDGRLDELIDNGEHKNLFFKGSLYEMHSFLFRYIGMALIFELMILVVLITAAVTNYEFEHRTALVTYTARRGRKLIIDKLIAATIANGVVMFALIGVTLSAFFLTYDYSGLWNVPISSYFNAEMPLPYISWWNLSFIEYVAIFVLLMMVSQLLFMGISFMLSVFLKNTYLVFFAFVILLGLGILLPSFAPMSSQLVFWLYYNPFAFILNPHLWLMGNGPFTIYANYEIVTISVWVFLLGLGVSYSIYRFHRQQLQ
ncbi:hypothetical protein GCM10008983_07520 [Lentibacillus halophilus]|uniref:ABC transporter permease n=1 Tax=Lentibacillus halophilus TaxID=295065 RepID=A0ABN0Z5I7_9BACI